MCPVCQELCEHDWILANHRQKHSWERRQHVDQSTSMQVGAEALVAATAKRREQKQQHAEVASVVHVIAADLPNAHAWNRDEHRRVMQQGENAVRAANLGISVHPVDISNEHHLVVPADFGGARRFSVPLAPRRPAAHVAAVAAVMAHQSDVESRGVCPVCDRSFPVSELDAHVNAELEERESAARSG